MAATWLVPPPRRLSQKPSASGSRVGKEVALQRREMYRRHSSVVSHTLGSGAPATCYSSSSGGETLSCSKSLKSHGWADAWITAHLHRYRAWCKRNKSTTNSTWVQCCTSSPPRRHIMLPHSARCAFPAIIYSSTDYRWAGEPLRHSRVELESWQWWWGLGFLIGIVFVWIWNPLLWSNLRQHAREAHSVLRLLLLWLLLFVLSSLDKHGEDGTRRDVTDSISKEYKNKT